MIPPAEICHISQTKQKWVVVIPDAPLKYEGDPKFRFIPEPMKDLGVMCLDAAKGMRCCVTYASWVGPVLWYDLLLPEPVTIQAPDGVPNRYRFLRITSDYVTIEDSGFMEAK